MFERSYYDVTLVELIDDEAVYQYQGREMRRPRGENRTWLENEVGKIGLLVVNKDSGEAGYFRPYLEQRLRRVMEFDTPTHWAWNLGDEVSIDAGFNLIKAGIIPGIGGAVIYDETEPVTIQVPPEFFELCEQYRHTPETMLRGFIADACGLMNYVKEPREDGYSSNGSDERHQAQGYIERAWAVFRDE